MALAKTGPSRGEIRQFDLQVRRASTVSTACAYLTERGRFELPLPLRADRFSKPAHSTTLPPLLFRRTAGNIIGCLGVGQMGLLGLGRGMGNRRRRVVKSGVGGIDKMT